MNLAKLSRVSFVCITAVVMYKIINEIVIISLQTACHYNIIIIIRVMLTEARTPWDDIMCCIILVRPFLGLTRQ